MQDSLEKFIRENRDQFDHYEPDPEIWKKVEKNIGPRRKINWQTVLLRAAGVAAIFVLSFLASEFIHRLRNNDVQAVRLRSREKEIIIPELQEAEAYYSSVINEKLAEIKPIMLTCPALEEELQMDFSKLDSIYIELKKDLRDNIANQEVIQAIIDNYRLKIDILEVMLMELEPDSDFCIPKNDNDYEM